jgi:tetratricopeptide (TPR) repeat protein
MRYKTAFAAFDASYEILPSNAQRALHLLSFFHWQNFCLDLISIAAEDNFSTNNSYLPHGEEFEYSKECLTTTFCPSGQWSLVELDSLITSLRSHSLVTVVSAEKVTLLQMHPLVHEWARRHLPRNDIKKFQSAAVRLLCCGARNNLHYMMQYIAVHVQALSLVRADLHVNDMMSFAFIMQESGLHGHAARLQEYVYKRLKVRLGVDHPYTISLSAYLASTYYELGRYGEAEELEKDVLRRRETLLGVDHPDTILASGDLARIYCSLGRYGEAEELETEVLQRRKRLLGVDHPHTVTASAYLAVTYRHLGRYSEAEVLQKEVLERRRTLLGVDHPDTIRTSANLAILYYRLKRYAEAEALERDVLRQRTAIFGDRHPETLRAMYCLAYICNATGRRSEAIELARKATQILLDTQGETHPLYIQTSTLLARLVRPRLSDQILAFLGKVFT